VRKKFNHIHAELRNIIERRFGVLMERWHILEKVPFFRREKQAQIIISCFALDSYLWLRSHVVPPPYRLSKWMDLNSDIDTAVVREWIATVLWTQQ
jgi:hypothetical protein